MPVNSPAPSRTSYAPLMALVAAVFVVGTAEYVVVGLLPELSEELRVSVSTAGLLVTGYALTVAFGGPLVTLLTVRLSVRRLLILLLGVFAVGNAIAASAASFGLLMAGRVATALMHSTFFAATIVAATSMVPRARRGWAIAVVSAGLNVATVLGYRWAPCWPSGTGSG